MQEDKEPDKPKEPENQEEIPPELEVPSVSEDAPDPEFEEQGKEPENQEEIPPELEVPSVSEDAPDPEFEEQKGEVLPPEKKKGSGCGFFLLIPLLLTGWIGYLYYTNHIPPQINKEIEPLLKPFKKQLSKLKAQFAPLNSKNSASEVEKEIAGSQIQNNIKKTPLHIEEHFSGSQFETTPQTKEGIANYIAEVSGKTTPIELETETSVKKSVVETQLAEAGTEGHETATQVTKAKIKEPEDGTEVEETPRVSPVMTTTPGSSRKPAEKSIEEILVEEKLGQRSEAVQAYLDFVESTVLKAGELIKEGFNKVRDFLLKTLS